ncbi:MCE family protein [Nocardioides sp. HDW12B]|uniref:MCE family protein n=1 Tax=Nocardioides sp. HDW12B TaxID=2714939 RepID=UPI00140B6CD9|nr:MCE family protein [Nocardioides sp. HDW12B]QIK66710.1 MCE family protein [Nocardioides sp. HDW12B]
MTRRDNDPKENARLMVAGVVFIAVSALLIGLSIAIYTKTFSTVTTVTLEADRAGLQLAKYGDVRYDGVLVGQIRDIDQTGDQAVITLGLEPESAEVIPSNVDASILPTTLFGRKFVSLVPPKDPGRMGVEDGTVIPADRVYTTVELSTVLTRLFPLLRTVRPADLSATLNALAGALNGRGEQAGATLEQFDTYLGTMNEYLPTLQDDLRLLASVAGTYDLAAPDLVEVLGNLTVTARTVTSEKDQLAGLLTDVTDLSDVTARILEDNEGDAIRAVRTSEPILSLLDKYSPEYECLLRGIAAYKPVLAKTFEGGLVKQYIEFPTTQRRGYDQRDRPEYADTRGPRCYGLPNNYPEPWPGLDLRNGTDLDSKAGAGNSYFPDGAEPGPTFLADLIEALSGQSTPFSSVDPTSTRSNRAATTSLLSLSTGRSTSAIPALSTYMLGPMVRTGEVATP